MSNSCLYEGEHVRTPVEQYLESTREQIRETKPDTQARASKPSGAESPNSPDHVGPVGLPLKHLVARLVLFRLVDAGAFRDGHADAVLVEGEAVEAVAALDAFPLAIRVRCQVQASVRTAVAAHLVLLPAGAVHACERRRIRMMHVKNR